MAVVLAAMAVSLGLSPDARAGVERLSEPVYVEETGSYYQLIGGFMDWERARATAERLTYQGRKGRLAILRSREVYREIVDAIDFRMRGSGVPRQTWIGLRYWCPTRELEWIDLTVHEQSDFSPWTTPWYGGTSRCDTSRGMPYMGVYIDGETKRWRAHGYAKGFPQFLVEFPDPDRSAQEAQAR